MANRFILTEDSKRLLSEDAHQPSKSSQLVYPRVLCWALFFFLIYVNDIADSLLSLTRLFADDSSLFYSASSLDDIQDLINHDLILLSQWAKQWLVTFNPFKKEAI